MSSPDSLEIDRLTAADVDAARRCSDQAGWPTRRADWELLVETPQIDAIAGRRDGDLVGTVTVVRYGDALAWIGMLLVDESERGRGFGSGLFEAAVDRARAAGVDVVALDANPDAKHIYESRGFVDAAPVQQWVGRPDDPSTSADVRRVTDADEIATLDREAAGVDRRFLLTGLLETADATAFRRDGDGKGDGGRGYALVRPTADGPLVGPVVADGRDTGRRLLETVASHRPDATLTTNVVDHDRSVRLLHETGFEHARTLGRMTDGADGTPLTGRRLWAIAGFAFG